jgi:2-amino-4-hydroxy-6-hydroxymethyldihydropteridine diphosphokinase
VQKNNIVFLSLGSNIGDKRKNIENAYSLISKQLGEIISVSSFFETAAWGNTNQDSFYNSVIKIQTDYSAVECLKKILSIEKRLGRIRTQKWQPRIIDIDILFFNHEIFQSEQLTIPHPFIQERNFVLFPLAEIANDFIHPLLNKKISTLISESIDKSEINKLNDFKKA